MMEQDDDRFEPRVGRPRGDKMPRPPKMRAEILDRIARRGGDPRRLKLARTPASKPRTGRFNARGRGAAIAASLPRGSGWSFDPRSGMRVRPRRVTVKARVVKLAGKATATASHLRYLERDGVTREGEPGRLYSTFTDEADGKAFLERGSGDRHQFRLIVSPEDGKEFADLHGFTRDLMAMEQDLGTTLDWVAVDHHDTGHPHAHIVIRGMTEDGKVLNIAGDYIAHGIRHRASEIMTRALGPQNELEVQAQLETELDAERLTRLDRAILDRAEGGLVDLRHRHDGSWGEPRLQQLLVARLRRLETMELAVREGPLVWSLDTETERTLADLGRRGDIIRTMHRAMTLAALDRRPELYAIHDPARDAGPIIGQVLRRGAADDDHDRRYLILDGIDGRTHYVDIGSGQDPAPTGSVVRLEAKRVEVRAADRTVAAIAAAHGGRYDIDIHLRHDPSATEDFAEAHVRRLEAIRRATGAVTREPDGTWIIAPDHLERAEAYERTKVRAAPMAIETLSTRPLDKLPGLDAPTWLDRELTASNPTLLANHGFGREVRQTLALRQQWLIEQQLAERQGDDVVYRAGLIATLRQRELTRVAGALGRELGLGYMETRAGEHVSGTYRRPVDLASGRYALIEKSQEFTLVPWRPVLERHIGRTVAGIMRKSGGIDWTIGRDRGPSIS